MKQLQPVQTKNVRETFSKNYIIPEFQRPYSWYKEECIKLFDDIKEQEIISFFETFDIADLDNIEKEKNGTL